MTLICCRYKTKNNLLFSVAQKPSRTWSENGCDAGTELQSFFFFFFWGGGGAVLVFNSLITLDLRCFLGILTLPVFKAHPVSRRDLPAEACVSFCEQVGMHQDGRTFRTATWFSAGRCELVLPVFWASQKLCSAPRLISYTLLVNSYTVCCKKMQMNADQTSFA